MILKLFSNIHESMRSQPQCAQGLTLPGRKAALILEEAIIKHQYMTLYHPSYWYKAEINAMKLNGFLLVGNTF